MTETKILSDISDLIGIQYKDHGRTKGEGFDCYGLVIEVLRRNGIFLPDYLYDEVDAETEKKVMDLALNGIPADEVDRPKPLDVVILQLLNDPCHCAVYLGYGKIIHSCRYGVVVEDLQRWGNRIKGYYRIKGNNQPV